MEETSSSAELVVVIRAVVFAGHDVVFAGEQDRRHKFGVRLLRVLGCGLSLTEPCAQHAMLLWTLAVGAAGRRWDMGACVACLMVSAKMHELGGGFGLRRFENACVKVFQSREQTQRALEWTLQQDTVSGHFRYLACALRLFECVDLTREVAAVSRETLKHAELHVLFTLFPGQWYHYFIELYEYLFAKTAGLSADARMHVALSVCGIEDA